MSITGVFTSAKNDTNEINEIPKGKNPMSNDNRFVIKAVRLSFPNLFTKAKYDGEETKYEATFLIPKEDEATLTIIKDAIKKELLEKFSSADKIPKGITKGVRNCLRDGDDVEYDGYAGCMSLKASNKNRPRTLGRDKKPVEADSGTLYAGCYVDAILNIWIQNNAYGSRINCSLMAVRFREDGDAFGAGAIPSDIDDGFEDLEDDELEPSDVSDEEMDF